MTDISMSQSPLAICLENCAKTFADGTRALEPLDHEISAGQTEILLGPSGSGKTTTLLTIAGLAATDAGGRVRFCCAAVPGEPRTTGNLVLSFTSSHIGED